MAGKAKCHNVRQKALHALSQIQRGTIKCPRWPRAKKDLAYAVKHPCSVDAGEVVVQVWRCNKTPGQFSGAKRRRRRSR